MIPGGIGLFRPIIGRGLLQVGLLHDGGTGLGLRDLTPGTTGWGLSFKKIKRFSCDFIIVM